jgi:protein gp37
VLRHRGIETWGPKGVRHPVATFEKTMMAMNRRPWICDNCGQAFRNTMGFHYKATTGSDTCDSPTFHRRRVFVGSNCDIFDERIPVETLAFTFDVLRRCSDMTLILCTKRPELFHARMEEALWFTEGLEPDDEGDSEDLPATVLGNWIHEWFSGHEVPKNIIILTSVENQEMANKRIPELLKIPAARRGLSLEPLLGPVDLTVIADANRFPGALSLDVLLGREIHHDDDFNWTSGGKVDWLIIGGESGPQARPCNVEWVGSMVQQGQMAGVATFVKQLGFRPITNEATPDGWPVGTKLVARTIENAVVSLCDKKGGDPAEWPNDLRVREWPEGF